MVRTREGVTRARTIRRKASGHERWNREKLDQTTTAPWNVGKDRIRDEDIKINIPGQDEEVRVAPKLEEKGSHEKGTSKSESKMSKGEERRQDVQDAEQQWAEGPTGTTRGHAGGDLKE